MRAGFRDAFTLEATYWNTLSARHSVRTNFMKFSSTFAKGHLSICRGTLVFEEAVKAIRESKEIWISTFNISLRPDPLLDELRKLDSSANLHLFTNIPGKLVGNREKWQRRVNGYVKALNPEGFLPKTDVRFNLDNHSKAIWTPTVGYVGSGNFSSPSIKSIEAGVCSSDPKFLATLMEFFKELQRASVPFCLPKHIEIGAEVLAFRSEVHSLADSVEDDFKTWNQHSEEMEEDPDFLSFSEDVINELRSFVDAFLPWAEKKNADIDLVSPAQDLQSSIEHFESLEIPNRDIFIQNELSDRAAQYVDDNKQAVHDEAQEAGQDAYESALGKLRTESQEFARTTYAALLDVENKLSEAISKIAALGNPTTG